MAYKVYSSLLRQRRMNPSYTHRLASKSFFFHPEAMLLKLFTTYRWYLHLYQRGCMN
jgi:hypothetical protein